MVTIVFVIGALNFGLGIGLAVLLERPLPVLFSHGSRRWWKARKAIGLTEANATSTSPADAAEETRETQDPPAVRNDFPWLPAAWAELLAQRNVAVQSFPEALHWVTYTKCLAFCDQLSQLDQQSFGEPPVFPRSDVRALCGEFRDQFAALKTAIGECKEPGSHGDQLVHFIQWIQEAVQQLEEVQQYYDQLETNSIQESDYPGCRQRLLQVFSQLQTVAYRSLDSLARILCVDKRLSELKDALILEPKSSALNRLGLEVAVQQWIEKDPDRVRMASVMLIDVDQTTKLNTLHGISLTNRLLSGVLSLLVEVMRKDRGFDRVAQLSGQTFLVFLGDTATRNAVTGAERVRQNVALAVFKTQGKDLTITTRCAVTEWNPCETFDELTGRLQKGLVEAKAAGSNCTVACGPDENRVIQSSRLQINAREIALEA